MIAVVVAFAVVLIGITAGAWAVYIAGRHMGD